MTHPNDPARGVSSLAPSPKNDHAVLIHIGLALAAFCVPGAVPIAVTAGAWVLGATMRIGLIPALVATFVIFLVWLVCSEVVDMLLRRAELDRHPAGRVVSHVVSAAVLALGYFLFVDSMLTAAIMAAIVFVLFLCLAPVIEHWYEKPATEGGSGSSN